MSQPNPYASTIRTCLRFAVVMSVFALLAGIAFQESAKKLDVAELSAGLYIEARLHLALVHGHVFVTAVLMPIAMAGALALVRSTGGRTVSSRAQAYLTLGYLPCVSATVLLMLYKGYHVLLHVRAGETDLETIQGSLFGGASGLRHALYGLTHVGMALSLVVFLAGLWRALGGPDESPR